MGHLPMPESDMSVVQHARLPQSADDVARKHNIFLACSTALSGTKRVAASNVTASTPPTTPTPLLRKAKNNPA
jgi:hypothetical protein